MPSRVLFLDIDSQADFCHTLRTSYRRDEFHIHKIRLMNHLLEQYALRKISQMKD
jgi:hypothetical protein